MHTRLNVVRRDCFSKNSALWIQKWHTEKKFFRQNFTSETRSSSIHGREYHTVREFRPAMDVARVAQSVERVAFNHNVQGSSPCSGVPIFPFFFRSAFPFLISRLQQSRRTRASRWSSHQQAIYVEWKNEQNFISTSIVIFVFSLPLSLFLSLTHTRHPEISKYHHHHQQLHKLHSFFGWVNEWHIALVEFSFVRSSFLSLSKQTCLRNLKLFFFSIFRLDPIEEKK